MADGTVLGDSVSLYLGQVRILKPISGLRYNLACLLFVLGHYCQAVSLIQAEVIQVVSA